MGKPERSARFLLLHSETGGGHRRAALAVAEALKDRYGERAQVELVDALAAYAPWPLRRAPDWYGKALWGGGRTYGLGYRLLDGRRRAQALSRLFWPRVAPAARRLLAEHPADVVATFHPLPVHTISRALSEEGLPIPLVAVGTDLVVMHAFWADPHVRRYLVATGQTRDQLVHHGVSPDRVEVTGLPVGRHFREAAREDPAEVRRGLGLDPEKPLLLLMGGGEGFGPMERVARAVAGARLPAQVTVLTGRNERLHTRLQRVPWPGPVRVEGFTHEVHRWMRAADLLVTKAGPNTLAEALVVGVPLVLWGAIPAQETPNVGLVVRAGAGVWAPGPRRTVVAAARLLGDVVARARMGEQARKLARPEAAERVAQALWEIVRR
ncbi:MAG TPA: galactosyldiacylglycerol synthase [Anaerolineales bacterium]|nr:galactosyldiacylglycerol synthase [Anaerolineae bacterium]HIQ02324.1 galactosyldiacylglycerol synthase [Anaerolineales bacterium]